MSGFWNKVLDPIPLLQNLIFTLIWLLVVAAVAYIAYRFGRKVHPVRIRARKIVGPELARTRPSILIATVSPYPRSAAPDLTDEEFAAALKSGDVGRLPLSPGTQSIGHTVRVIDTYRDSVKELFLITTMSEGGGASFRSVPLLRNYAMVHSGDLKVHGGEQYAISLDDDTQVAESAHEVTRLIFNSLRSEGRYIPDDSAILVDVTGGPRALQIGVLLACLRPEQDIHLIGMRYTSNGSPDFQSAFPMVIHFEPDLRLSG